MIILRVLKRSISTVFVAVLTISWINGELLSSIYSTPFLIRHLSNGAGENRVASCGRLKAFIKHEPEICRHAAVAIPYATPRAWGETDKSRWDPYWCTESASTVQMIKGFANRDVFIETLSKLAWLPWNKGRSCTLQHSHNNLEVKFPLNICKTRSICKSGKKNLPSTIHDVIIDEQVRQTTNQNLHAPNRPLFWHVGKRMNQ